MGRYVIRRLLWAVLVVFVVTLLTFVIFYVMPPGDPAIRFAGKQPTPEIDRRGAQSSSASTSRSRSSTCSSSSGSFTGDNERMPAGDRRLRLAGSRISYDSRTAVRQEIIDRAPRTISLALGAAVLWLVMGITIGIISALKRRSAADRFAMGFALFGISAPVFWLGLLALFIFGAEARDRRLQHRLRRVHGRPGRAGSATWSSRGSSCRCSTRPSTRA